MTSTIQTYLPQTPYHVRALKIHKALSEETTCFSATLYKGTTKIAEVTNRGCGGCHEYPWKDRDHWTGFLDYAEAMPEAHFPEEWGGGTYKRGIDGLVDLLVAEEEAFKMAKKYLTFIDREGDIESGVVNFKVGRKKTAASELEVRDQILASHPNLLWIDPNTVR